MGYRAVIFDLGGVVFPSPFDAFDVYERAHGLPERFVRTVIAQSADHGAWARLERSDVPFEVFCAELEAECEAAGGTIRAADLMAEIGRDFAPRPAMLGAIRTIKAHGLLVGALTNNWATMGGPGDHDPHALGHLGVFDVVVESAVEGLRKPDPRIYELVCERLDVAPPEAVFLDDLGINLKPARAIGMTTIKVTDPDVAVAELATVLGFSLDVA